MRLLTTAAAVALVACQPKPADVDINPRADSALTVTLSVAHAVLAEGSDFPFSAHVDRASSLVVEVHDTDGSIDVFSRQAVSDNSDTAVELPSARLPAGVHVIAVYAQALGHVSSLQRVQIDVRVPDLSLSPVDADGDGYSPALGDCDDTNPNVHPLATENCNDGIDNDCNGLFDYHDPVCAGLCNDDDRDGYGAKSCGGTDCDDSNALVHPGATEVCDGLDNDCNCPYAEAAGGIWQGKPAAFSQRCVDETFDADGDGSTTCAATTQVTAYGGAAPAKNDCDDTDPQIAPGLSEAAFGRGCDGKDNDCSGFDASGALIGAGTRYIDDGADLDGDGFTTCGSGGGCALAAAPPCTAFVYTGLSPSQAQVPLTPALADCNDDPTHDGLKMYPGNVEVCDGLDNDCSCPYGQGGNPVSWGALTPAGFSGPLAHCIDSTFDADGDGFAQCPSGPATLLRNVTGQTCVTNIVNHAPSCFDCNECGHFPSGVCTTGISDGAGIHPTASGGVSVEVSACSDAVDNDCDGFADQLDGDCATCLNQREVFHEGFDENFSVTDLTSQNFTYSSPDDYTSAHWTFGVSKTRGPISVKLDEGRSNQMLGTDGNFAGTATSFEGAENSTWVMGASITDQAASPKTLAGFSFSGPDYTNTSLYFGVRSYTYNQGWDYVHSGGNCQDLRNYPQDPGYLPYADTERLRVAFGTNAQTNCRSSTDFTNFEVLLNCEYEPQLGAPFDGKLRVFKRNMTDLIGKSNVIFCGRFSNFSYLNAEDCQGGDGVSCPTGDTQTSPPCTVTQCKAGNEDDGWYLDDVLIYTCDNPSTGANACDESEAPLHPRVPTQFRCGPQAACCNALTQYCAGGACQVCAATEQACNTVCCPLGQYCADWSDSQCTPSNLDRACGADRADCRLTSPPRTCAASASAPIQDCTVAQAGTSACSCQGPPVTSEVCGPTGLNCLSQVLNCVVTADGSNCEATDGSGCGCQ